MNIKFLLLTFALLPALTACKDAELNLEKPEGGPASRSVIAEGIGESLSNPTLLTDWENVEEIVLNKTVGNNPVMVTAPWGNGVTSLLPETFRHDIKKEDGWTMLFHTFKNGNSDDGQSYMFFYNLFTGVVKVFYYYDNDVNATNTQWKFGTTSTILKMFDVPTYLSKPNDAIPDSVSAVAVANATGSYPTAISRGWNGFEYKVPQYSTDLQSADITINALNQLVTNYQFDGVINLETTGTVTSVTLPQSMDKNQVAYLRESVANLEGDALRQYIIGMTSSSRGASEIKKKLLNSLEKLAKNALEHGMEDVFKKGLGIVFGSSSKVTINTTFSGVSLTTDGKVTLTGAGRTDTQSGVYPISFNLYDILHAHNVPSNNNLVYSQNNSSTNTLNNLGVWTIKSKPKTYWELTVPFVLDNPFDFDQPFEYDFVGTVQAPKYRSCSVDVMFNPAIEPFITSYKVETKLYNCMFKPYDNPIHRFAPPMLESCMVYDDTTKTIYDISDKTSYHVGILAQLEPYRDFNNNTDLRFKWSSIFSYDTLVLVTVEMNIDYMGKSFKLEETRVYKADVVDCSAVSHNPPSLAIVNNNPRSMIYSIH